MNKRIFIVNGKAGAGKDTFAEILSEYTKVFKYSSVMKVKTIALDCGWRGKKTDRDRLFLSELKRITSAYSDMSFYDVKEKACDFLCHSFYDDFEIMLIDIREPEEIERACKAFNAQSIYIRNDNVELNKSNYADANVEDYDYDYILSNNGTLEEFERVVEDFYEYVSGGNY